MTHRLSTNFQHSVTVDTTQDPAVYTLTASNGRKGSSDVIRTTDPTTANIWLLENSTPKR